MSNNNLKGAHIIGGNPINERHDRDFYPTPPEVTQALLNFLNIPKQSVIWECANGAGDMSDVIEKNGYSCIKTDIVDGFDFLTTERTGADWIITNPPFNLSEQFIHRAIMLDKSFAFLLKSQYWHSKKRYSLFMQHRPDYVLPLTWRPDFTGQGCSLLDCIWCVWIANKQTNKQSLNHCQNRFQSGLTY